MINNFILIYFVCEKYIISRRKTINQTLSMFLSLEMIEYLEYCLPIYCFSNMIFRYQMFGEIPLILFIATVIGLAFCWLPT